MERALSEASERSRALEAKYNSALSDLQSHRDQAAAEKRAYETAAAGAAKQLEQLQKQLRDVQGAAERASAKATRDEAASAENEIAALKETVSQLKHLLRAAENHSQDAEKLVEETLRQERLKSAQTVAQLTGRCDLLQKQLEDAQSKLAFEQSQLQSRESSSASAQSAEVAALRGHLSSAERRLEHATEQLQEKEVRISKLSDELKAAAQRQVPSSTFPAPAPTPSRVDGSKRHDGLLDALEKMQQNREILARELNKEMAKSSALADKLHELNAVLQEYSVRLLVRGEHTRNSPALVVERAEPKPDDRVATAPVVPTVEERAVASNVVEPAIGRLPPPSATKDPVQEARTPVDSETTDDRKSWWKLWGSESQKKPGSHVVL